MREENKQTVQTLQKAGIQAETVSINQYYMHGVGTQPTFTGHNGQEYTWTEAKKLAEDYANSPKEEKEDTIEEFDWFQVKLQEVNEALNLAKAQLENMATSAEKNAKIDEIIAKNKAKIKTLEGGEAAYNKHANEALAQISPEYKELAKSGAILNIEKFENEEDKKQLDLIQKYRKYVELADELKQEQEELVEEIRDYAIQRIDNVYKTGDLKAAIEDAQSSVIQNKIDLDEAMGNITSAQNYVDMMQNSQEKLTIWTERRTAAQKAFNEAIANGMQKGSDEYNEQVQTLYDIEEAIADATLELEEYQNEINNIYWDHFDELIEKFDLLESQANGLIDIMSEADMVVDPDRENGWNADEVKWTKEGLATMGLHAQNMERAEEKAQKYADAIDDLTADYKAGKYSESEYTEKLSDLVDKQNDAIKTAQQEKKAIVDVQKARVDSIKNGINKQIDAYKKLIDLKKDELSAEKDLHDFQKGVQEQQKSIADIQRKLMALSTDNSSSAIAQRKQLEAELATARAELEETFYDRSVQVQQDALDKELEDFEEEKNKEIEKWEEYLENIEKVVADSLEVVRANATSIGATLTEKTNEYNLTVSEAILSPWKSGSAAISEYTTTFGDSVSKTTEQLDSLSQKWEDVAAKTIQASNAASNYWSGGITSGTKEYTPKYAEAPNTVETQTINIPDSKPTTYTVKSGDNLSTIAQNVLGSASRWKEIYELNKDIISNPNLIYPGWKLKLPKYAKGTTGVASSGLAIVDENMLEELVLGVQDGRLTYLSKGSAVMPADITSNLMSWGELDPSAFLDQNRPSITPNKNVINTEINLDCSISELVHIEHCDQNTLPDVEKIVNKAFEKHMQNINNSLKRFTR